MSFPAACFRTRGRTVPCGRTRTWPKRWLSVESLSSSVWTASTVWSRTDWSTCSSSTCTSPLRWRTGSTTQSCHSPSNSCTSTCSTRTPPTPCSKPNMLVLRVYFTKVFMLLNLFKKSVWFFQIYWGRWIEVRLQNMKKSVNLWKCFVKAIF